MGLGLGPTKRQHAPVAAATPRPPSVAAAPSAAAPSFAMAATGESGPPLIDLGAGPLHVASQVLAQRDESDAFARRRFKLRIEATEFLNELLREEQLADLLYGVTVRRDGARGVVEAVADLKPGEVV